MFRTKEEFASEKAKMARVKSSISKCCKTVERQCKRLEEMLEKADFPEITARKTAQDINKYKGLIEQHLEDLEVKGAALMEVIYGMNAEETEEKDLDKIVEKVSEDINEYNLKYDNLQSANAATLEGADKLLHQKPTPATQKESSGNPTRFNSYPDLKPTFLNQDSTMIDIDVQNAYLT